VPMGRPIEEVERRYIMRSLEMLNGNKARTAQVLGISKKTLYRRLHEWGVALDPEDETESGAVLQDGEGKSEEN